MTYQWRLNGVGLAGATNTVLSLTAITVAQGGAYDVVITGPNGVTTSSRVQVAVVPNLVLAGLLNNLTGYYPFESQTGGVVSNAVRAAGAPGYPFDGAILYGGTNDPSAFLPPLTTNQAKALAGAAAQDCGGNGDYGTITGNPVDQTQDWTMSVWFKPNTAGLGLPKGSSTRYAVWENSGSYYPMSYGLLAGTDAAHTTFQLYTYYDNATSANATYQVPNASVDQWHHLTVVHSNTTIYGYLDGVVVQTISLTRALHSYTGLNVGTYRSANGRWFTGQIDELALWQRALAASEVSALLAAGQQGQSLATRVGQPGGAGLVNNLMAYYTFDTQTAWVVANSASALGATGTFANDGLALKGGHPDPSAVVYPLTHDSALARAGLGALACNGSNVYAHIIGNPVDPNLNWSVAAWFKPNTGGQGITNTARLFVLEAVGNYPISFGLRQGTADPNTGAPRTDFQLYTYTAASTSAFQDYYLPNTQVDQWHHIVITYDPVAGVMTGYLDGSPTHSLVLATGTTLASYSGLNIGTYRNADTRWFSGLIDEVYTWQRTLSPAAVALAYSLGNDGVATLTSQPRILGFNPTVPTGGYSLSWQSVAGLKYNVLASSDLTNWTATVVTNYVAATNVAALILSGTQPPPVNGFFDPGLTGAKQRFYRVQLNP